MARNPSCTMFIGNLDEKVTDRVLYEILIQVGRVVDLYIPMDKETNRHKGYAFAEYESEEIANYAVRLFSGLVCLHNRTLRFSMSGQDKPSQQHNGTPVTPKSTSLAPLPREKKPYQGSAELTDFRALTNSRYSAASVNPSPNSGLLPRLQHPLNPRESPVHRDESSWPGNCRSDYAHPASPSYPQARPARGYVNGGVDSDYSRQVLSPMWVNADRSDFQHPVYPAHSRRP